MYKIKFFFATRFDDKKLLPLQAKIKYQTAHSNVNYL